MSNGTQNYGRVEVLRDGLLDGCAALVTGAGTGIGRAIALRLCALGMRVHGIARREEPLAETAAFAEALPGSFDFATCDVRETEALEATISAAGDANGIDLLVNNAGGQFFAPATGISQRGWNSLVDLNLYAVFAATRSAYPFLRKRRGAVVFISLSGVDRAGMGFAHSIAARAGVQAMTRSLVLEWASDGIRLNCVGPGTVVTAGLADKAARQLLVTLVAATPMSQSTSVEELAELVAYLASPAARLMTGQLIQIDGAAHLGPGLHMLSA